MASLLDQTLCNSNPVLTTPNREPLTKPGASPPITGEPAFTIIAIQTPEPETHQIDSGGCPRVRAAKALPC